MGKFMLLESDKVKIGEIIKLHRKKMKMTQFELAEKVGLNEKQISRIELGLNYPTYTTFINLVNVLDINILEFLKVNPKPAPLVKNDPIQDEIERILTKASNVKRKVLLEIIRTVNKNLD